MHLQLVCNVAAFLAVLHTTEVCDRAVVVEEVGAQLTNPVWVVSAEVGKDSVTGLVISWVIKMIPGADSDLVNYPCS